MSDEPMTRAELLEEISNLGIVACKTLDEGHAYFGDVTGQVRDFITHSPDWVPIYGLDMFLNRKYVPQKFKEMLTALLTKHPHVGRMQ